MMRDDYNRNNYGSIPAPPPVQSGVGVTAEGQYGSQMMGQQQYGQQQYSQQPFSFTRPSSIAGSPAQSSPAIPALSEEDIRIFKETQRSIMINRFLPAAAMGCGAIYMAHQKKFFKPSAWTYAVYVVSASYITQFMARGEMRKRIAESSSMSPFAQQTRMQLGYVNRQGDANSFMEESFEPSYSSANTSSAVNSATSSPYYSPYNRYHKQKANLHSEFADEFDSETKASDPRFNSTISNEFAAEDVAVSDPGFRTRRTVEPVEKSRLTYEELRMRNRSQYNSAPASTNQSYMQPPMNPNDRSEQYRPGSF